MEKILIKLICLVLSVALLVINYRITSDNEKTIRCQADILDSDMINHIEPLLSEIRMNFIFNINKESIVNLTGYITYKQKKYRFLRTRYFSLDLSDDKDIYNLKYSHEKIHVNDNTPMDVLNHVTNLHFDEANTHVRIEKIYGNTYLIHGISQPLALCYRY